MTNPNVSATYSRYRGKRAEVSKVPELGEFPPHPLFPVEAGEPCPNVRYISVSRHTKTGHFWARRLFRADQLTELQQISALYGGGDYELVARDEFKGKPGHLTKKQVWSIEGPSKPLNEDENEKEEAPAPAQVAPTLPGGISADPLSLMFLMMQQQQQMQQQASERSERAADRQMQMIVSMMGGMNAQAVEAAKANAALFAGVLSQKGNEAASLVSATGQLAQTFANNATKAPPSSMEEMLKLLELFKKLKGSGLGKEEDSITEIMGAVGQVLPGFAALMQANHEREKYEQEQRRLVEAQERQDRQDSTQAQQKSPPQVVEHQGSSERFGDG